ncbi:hypothetical protein GWK47_042567 [Chionoecetes opilio]|uniref:Uncharacterized protein n=1 Tax=Chionoecetes opilio TaxID=41210 RepID=A0A8J4YAB3_CHIOP|nr:hypothetical protein GWK47_042567 [Chionoecetes opilio]
MSPQVAEASHTHAKGVKQKMTPLDQFSQPESVLAENLGNIGFPRLKLSGFSGVQLGSNVLLLFVTGCTKESERQKPPVSGTTCGFKSFCTHAPEQSRDLFS